MWNECGWKMKSGKNERILAKKSGYTLGISVKNHLFSCRMDLVGNRRVAKMSEFWPKSKVIHLVFRSKITYFHLE